jgi:Uma2 family endonuclease
MYNASVEQDMTTMVQELAAHPELVYRHTVEEYHEMIANGSVVEGEPFELLDGQVVRKIRSAHWEDITTVGVEHALIVGRLARMTTLFEPHGCHIRSQQPITMPPRDEPEPDAAVVRGALEDYTTRHPYPADVLCIIEVADSSLPRDRGYKLQRYAEAGVPMYVIVNLIDRVIEAYESPAFDGGTGTYAVVRKHVRGESLQLPTITGEAIVVPVERMFL